MIKKISPLAAFSQNVQSVSEAYHLHACRPGPLNANDIYLSLQESQTRPCLKKIRAVVHPKGIVAKHLWYWLNGVSPEIVEHIAQNLKLNGSVLSNIKGQVDLELLTLFAEETSISKNNFLDVAIAPILSHFTEQFNFLKELRLSDIPLPQECSLESALLNSSLYFTNYFLSSKKIAIYVPEFLEGIPSQTKGINHQILMNKTIDKEHKLRRKYEMAANIIRKEIKSYNDREISLEDSINILKRYHKKNPLQSSLNLSYSDVLAIANNQNYLPTPSFLEFLDVTNSSFSESITPISSETVPYLDGKAMVSEVFKICHKKQKPIILQEFSREDDYTVYLENLQKYPLMTILPPICKTWDVKNFPYYELNLFNGFKLFNE